jgi:hypothetical protein
MRVRGPSVIVAVALTFALLLVAIPFVDWRAQLSQLLVPDCVLDGKRIDALPRDIDIVIAPEVLPVVRSDSWLHPQTLIRSGLARQVYFRGRVYSLNGPYLASRPSEVPSLPNSWLISLGESRKLTWRKTAKRVTVTNPEGRQAGFVEYLRRNGCVTKPGAPASIMQVLGIRLDGPSFPSEVDPRHPRRSVKVEWHALPMTELERRRAAKESTRCPTSVGYFVDWSMHIRFEHSELHPIVRPFLLCAGNSLYVVQHEGRGTSSAAWSLLINRFDIKGERWLGVVKFEAPSGLYLAALSGGSAPETLEITVGPGIGSPRTSEPMTAHLDLSALVP